MLSSGRWATTVERGVGLRVMATSAATEHGAGADVPTTAPQRPAAGTARRGRRAPRVEDDGSATASEPGRGSSFGDRRTASGRRAGQQEETAARRQRQGQGAARQRAGGAARGVAGWAWWRLEARLAGAGDGAASQTAAASGERRKRER
ncbi:hypothetical protein E2562_007892 [Oryza meyeriana var. granulata]|uniref:Uncharacterized protein n=1 Tax=Oryza meyeriana var. granulata TaxID=110450 RepID=A0A6G1DUT2_9ORYZ|nr:hypothetical protein E2562_007892 [Oryza meyeriana var. granulata]